MNRLLNRLIDYTRRQKTSLAFHTKIFEKRQGPRSKAMKLIFQTVLFKFHNSF